MSDIGTSLPYLSGTGTRAGRPAADSGARGTGWYASRPVRPSGTGPNRARAAAIRSVAAPDRAADGQVADPGPVFST